MIYLKKIHIHPEKFPVTDHYPFKLKLFQNTKEVLFNTPITFFCGENGTGKSTLLKAAAIKCGIHIWQDRAHQTIAANPYEQRLYETIDVCWENGMTVPGSFFGSQMFQHFSNLVEEWALTDINMLEYFGGKSLVSQSHGQSLMSFFKSRYSIKGIYFLDEPETALSPSSLIELLNLLIEVSRQGHAQFIIVTHSPLLLACPDAAIYSFDATSIQPVRYHDTQYYKLYRSFMNEPEQFIRKTKQD